MKEPPALRVLVVDDEAPARRRLRRLLAAHAEVEVVGEAADAPDAAAAIDSLRPDAVFLDVRMPGGSGFSALARARHRPWVVFVTAYGEHALEAFERDTLDYLVKPVDETDLERCLGKLRRVQAAGATLEPPRLQCRRGGRVELLDADRVVYVATRDKYAVAYSSDGGEWVLDEPLYALERRLQPHGFVRLHRGLLVRLAGIARVAPDGGGRSRVLLRAPPGLELRTSRAGARALRRALREASEAPGPPSARRAGATTP